MCSIIFLIKILERLKERLSTIRNSCKETYNFITQSKNLFLQVDETKIAAINKYITRNIIFYEIWSKKKKKKEATMKLVSQHGSSERQIVLFPSPAWRDKTGETRAFEHFLTTDDSMRSLSLHFSVDHILRPPLHDASNPILLLHYSDSIRRRINANRGKCLPAEIIRC